MAHTYVDFNGRSSHESEYAVAYAIGVFLFLGEREAPVDTKPIWNEKRRLWNHELTNAGVGCVRCDLEDFLMLFGNDADQFASQVDKAVQYVHRFGVSVPGEETAHWIQPKGWQIGPIRAAGVAATLGNMASLLREGSANGTE